jgi:uncharacterized membrane protein YhaH (DUF805 family)
MKNENYFSRFGKMTKDDYIIIGFLTLVVILGLYFSIAFSVKMSMGYTLFGDSSKYVNDTMEVSGPTSADLYVLILFWVLTVLALAIDVFLVFFRKTDKKDIVRKEIVDGKAVIVKEEKDEK